MTEQLTDILEAPCLFCGYNGKGYWQTETHDRACPWYKVGGYEQREYQFRAIIKKIMEEYSNIITFNRSYSKDIVSELLGVLESITGEAAFTGLPEEKQQDIYIAIANAKGEQND